MAVSLNLLPIEKVGAVYCAATSLLMVVMMPRLVEPEHMALLRVGWLVMTLGLAYLTTLLKKHSSCSCKLLSSSPAGGLQGASTFLRTVAQMVWLILWYPDTYEFNRCFANLDHTFAQLDLTLFGCQPALEFYQWLPGTAWSEAFCMGYWSYFPMIALLSLVVLWKGWQQGNLHTFKMVTATIMASFFLFYAIYIFLPVAGPQFYFQAVGADEIAQGHFPALGTYFSCHTDMLPSPGNPDGLFYRLVSSAQDTGERPTAAFPSSHIGISTILLLLARRHAPRLLFVLLPLWFLLCCATVYIQAHYLVDAIAGLISAPIILALAQLSLRGYHSKSSAS